MFRDVAQHIDECGPDLARRGEPPRVIAITPATPVPFARPVHRLGDANHQALHPTHEECRRVRFDQQVHVVLLDAELQHTKAGGRRGGQGRAHRTEHLRAAERRHTGCCTQGDVHRAVPIVRLPRAMGNTPSAGNGRAARTAPRATPGAKDESRLPGARHLESGIYYSILAPMSISPLIEARGATARAGAAQRLVRAQAMHPQAIRPLARTREEA